MAAYINRSPAALRSNVVTRKVNCGAVETSNSTRRLSAIWLVQLPECRQSVPLVIALHDRRQRAGEVTGIHPEIERVLAAAGVRDIAVPKEWEGTVLSAEGGPAVVADYGDIEVIQVFYQWPLFATMLGFDFSNLSSGLDLLVATAAFRNEPY